MPKTTLRYAIIGFGGIAENRIAKEGFARDASRFEPLPGIELTAAADISPSAGAAAEKMGLKWHDSPEALLADPAIDAVFIASNNASHFRWGKRRSKPASTSSSKSRWRHGSTTPGGS